MLVGVRFDVSSFRKWQWTKKKYIIEVGLGSSKRKIHLKFGEINLILKQFQNGRDGLLDP